MSEFNELYRLLYLFFQIHFGRIFHSHFTNTNTLFIRYELFLFEMLSVVKNRRTDVINWVLKLNSNSRVTNAVAVCIIQTNRCVMACFLYQRI